FDVKVLGRLRGIQSERPGKNDQLAVDGSLHAELVAFDHHDLAGGRQFLRGPVLPTRLFADAAPLSLPASVVILRLPAVEQRDEAGIIAVDTFKFDPDRLQQYVFPTSANRRGSRRRIAINKAQSLALEFIKAA